MAVVADASTGLKGKARAPAPTDQHFLQHGPSVHPCVCSGAHSRGFPGEAQPWQVTNAPLPSFLPPEWA